MLLDQQERIICAAYRFKEGYITPNMEKYLEKGDHIENIYNEPHREVFFLALGWRHPDILYKYGDVIDKNDLGGFLTSKGRYVDRQEAAKIAVAAGQVQRSCNYLYSEDIY